MSAKRYTDEQKTSWLEEFNQQGGSAAAFCRDRQLPYQSFTKWLRASRVVPEVGEEEPAGFVEIDLSPQSARVHQESHAPAVELALGNGMVLRIFHPQLSPA